MVRSAAPLFGSFAEADRWLAGAGRLHPFRDHLPAGTAEALQWLIPLDPGLVRAVQALQHELTAPWLEPTPSHFLHLSVGPGDGSERWDAVAPFTIELTGVHAFPTAVVAAAHGGVPRAPAVDPATFLPHLTLAVVTEARPAAELRPLLAPLRGRAIGVQRVLQLHLVSVAVEPHTFFSPWKTLRVVELQSSTPNRSASTCLHSSSPDSSRS